MLCSTRDCLLLAALSAFTAGLAARPAGAQPAGVSSAEPRRPVSTYSIVARDSTSGELGVAVQSHWFSVGSVVPWAASGVGAVATQSFTDPAYGALGLEMMRSGKSAPETLAGLVASDANEAVRQVGMVDAQGRTAVHTGASAIAEACDRTGPGFTVQANLMLRAGVCDAMVRAYETSSGDLAERLMVTLEAAQEVGGDLRGKQSAALLVVAPHPSGRPWEDRLFDLRVEDHPDPLVELRRVLTVARAYRHMNAGDEHVTAGEIDRALEEYRRAEELLPDRSEPIFWHAVTLVSEGMVEEALPLFAAAYELHPAWRTLVPRIVAVGLLPDDPALVAGILEAGR
ncbi:MAG: DUF1028 domain-containing protein [Gemmatimonadales bacterium]|jgi:uncharacterized Ntn-hydrolase superfamily protein